jgi:Na+/H+ antiporter NhaC
VNTTCGSSIINSFHYVLYSVIIIIIVSFFVYTIFGIMIL